MENLILFIFCSLFTFLGRFALYLVSKRKKKKKKTKNNSGIAVEMKYLIQKFKLKETRIDKKSMALLISFLDAIIVSSTLIIVINITERIYLQLPLGLIVVIALIYVLYEIFGRILKWKGFDKDGL